MGYTGGTKDDPTYHALGDHSETVQLDYDPAVITYEELLTVFFKGHDATRRVGSRQYMSAVFHHDAEQERLAREAKAALERELGKTVYTETIPAATFYMAEDYHQKYWLQSSPEMVREFSRIYPDFKDIINSTAAARVNGIMGSHATLDGTMEELSSYGLSPEANKILAETVRRLERKLDKVRA